MDPTPSNVSGETLESTGGIKLFFRSWHPSGTPRALVIIVPGFNAHSGYYTWVGEQLASMGLAVYAVDLRGRGRSDGERFYVDSFQDYVSDVEAVVAMAKSREPDVPMFVLGHSAGGVVACLYTLDHQPEIAGLISESFAYQIPAPGIALSVFKGLGRVAPHAHILHLPNERFSRDPKVVAAMNADPLIANETQPTQTMAAMVRADEKIKGALSRITLPVLVLHGKLDKNTKPSGSQSFYDHIASQDKTLKLYDGAVHDLLNDTDKEAVMAEIKSWIAARMPDTAASKIAQA
jgi:alpha-beta hydrolase superfamily lysophospholipase